MARYNNVNLVRDKKVKKSSPYYASITFICKQCGKTVITEEGVLDKRTRFCNSICERKYWRHPPKESTMFVYYGKPDYDLKE